VWRQSTVSARTLRDAAAAERRRIERRADGLSAEDREFLGDKLYELDEISHLADQLAIVALYRVVEINTVRILAHKFGPTAKRNIFHQKAAQIFDAAAGHQY